MRARHRAALALAVFGASAGPALANGGWGYFVLVRPWYAVFVVAWGLLFEYPFVRLSTGFAPRKAALATLAMNAVSAAVGAACALGVFSSRSIPAGVLTQAILRARGGGVGLLGAPEPFAALWTSLILVGVNVLIEATVLSTLLRVRRWWWCVGWMVIANFLSVVGVMFLAEGLQAVRRAIG